MLRKLLLIAGVGCLSSPLNLIAQNTSLGTAPDQKLILNISEIEPIQKVRLSSDFIPDAPSVTKEKQQFHGLFYGYRGLSLVNSTDVLPEAQLPLREFGGALGGDIAHGNTSYFVSYDQYGINRQLLLLKLAEHLGTDNAAFWGDANVLSSSAFAVRVDHRFSAGDSAYLRFNRDEMNGNSLKRGKDAIMPSFAKGLNAEQNNLEAGNALNLSPHTINSSKAQFISTEVQLPAGMQAIGLESPYATLRRNRVFQAADGRGLSL